ncbi:MAG TPA: PrsW family glutamic-type intramembrane protease [Thermoplasmata archaeon]|nr:PrsW family glutamic-type intramembrane protease [Thermoplasmata archaeon]
MTDFGAATDLIILVIVSFIPALIYLSWIRRTERYGREAWGPLLRAFAFGAFFATITAAILEGIIVYAGTAVSQTYPGPEFLFLNGNSNAGAFFLVLVIAPVVEEALKASGVVSYGSSFKQPADGPVFGASVGLGFGFFETFLYGLGAYLVGGLEAGIALILVRSVSSVLLHGSSTGMFGYGYARSKFGAPGPGTGSYYAVAVGMHASFNALASLAAILALAGVAGFANDAAGYLALLAAIFFAFWAIEHVRSIIQASDYPALLGATIPYKPPAKTRPPSGR